MKLLLSLIVWLAVGVAMYSAWDFSAVVFYVLLTAIVLLIGFHSKSSADYERREMDRYFDEARQRTGRK